MVRLRFLQMVDVYKLLGSYFNSLLWLDVTEVWIVL